MTNGNDPITGFEHKETFCGVEQRITKMGLTKREYFAAMAMQGFVSAGVHSNWEAVELAVKYADALIKALNE